MTLIAHWLSMTIDSISIFLPRASSWYFYAILLPSRENLALFRIAITFIRGNLRKIWSSSSRVEAIGWGRKSLIICRLSMRLASCFISRGGSSHGQWFLSRLFFHEAAFIVISFDSLCEKVGLIDCWIYLLFE